MDAQTLLVRGSNVSGRDGCWTWRKYKNPDGYGSVWWQGKMVGAHRLSYETFVGPIPSGMLVCHHCDNPSCVNPDHLFLGTNADNAADRDAKGRTARGSKNRHAKLGEDDVREIRRLVSEGWTCANVGALFNISKQQVSKIATGKRWAHV